MADTLPGPGAEPDDEEAEVDDDLHGGEESEAQSGLGRGLAAIIPTLADLDAPAPPATPLAVRQSMPVTRPAATRMPVTQV